MIVRAVDIGSDDPWVTAGNEYVVLEVNLTSRGVEVLIITDEGGRQRGMFPLTRFEIVDGRLSREWVVTRYPHLPEHTTSGTTSTATGPTR